MPVHFEALHFYASRISVIALVNFAPDFKNLLLLASRKPGLGISLR